MVAVTDTTQKNQGMFGAAASTANTQSADTAQETQDMFITLLVAQVQYQDPMNPMDNTEFTNQLTSFSQLSEQQQTNKSLQELNDFNATMSQTSYLNLLDRKVTAYGSEIVVETEGTGQNIEFKLSGDSNATTMTLIDNRGMIRASLDIGQKNIGDSVYNWNGLDENGRALPKGNYQVLFSGLTPEGGDVSGALYSTGLVSTVTGENGETIVKLQNGQRVSTKDIIRVESK